MNDHYTLSWEEDRPAGSWQRHLTLPGLLALGWLVFEATSQPALGVVVVCVKFGWNDFVTAYWLRVRDPEPRRGRACFWLYLTSGFWKMGGGACVLCIFLVVIQVCVEAQNPPPQGGWKEPLAVIINTALVVVAALSLAALFALRSLWLAWLTGTRLWLHPAVHQARRQNSLPASVPGSSSRNRAEFVFPWIFSLFLVTAITLDLTIREPKADRIALGFIAAVIFFPAILLGLRRPLFGWALAKNPGECWNDLASGGRMPPGGEIAWDDASHQGAYAPRSQDFSDHEP